MKLRFKKPFKTAKLNESDSCQTVCSEVSDRIRLKKEGGMSE
ncbi:hypothetical protein [Ruminococcus bicirculans (ex Wegman et al. 2014)]